MTANIFEQKQNGQIDEPYGQSEDHRDFKNKRPGAR
jgi:hypothetical protein